MLYVFQSTCYSTMAVQLNIVREKHKLNRRISHLFLIFLRTQVSCLFFPLFFIPSIGALLCLVQQFKVHWENGQGMNASRQPNKCHIMEMDRNRRKIYYMVLVEHINVNMDFKRFFSSSCYGCVFTFTFIKLKFVMTRLLLPDLNVGIS